MCIRDSSRNENYAHSPILARPILSPGSVHRGLRTAWTVSVHVHRSARPNPRDPVPRCFHYGVPRSLDPFPGTGFSSWVVS
eukprot:2442519-Pyramimonas_sp.AAC.1